MNLLNNLTKKNLKLNKKRTIVTIIGIILSVALITSVATIYVSGLKSIVSYEKKIKGNFHVAYFNVPVNEVKEIEQNEGVDKVFLTNEIGYAKLNDSKNEAKPYAYILGLDNDALNNLTVSIVEGRLPVNENEILITTHLETNARIKYNVGDIVELEVGKRYFEDEKLNQENSYIEEEEIKNIVKKQYKIVGKIKRPATNVEPYEAPGYTFITYLNKEKMTNTVNVYTLYNKEGTKNYMRVTANIIGVNPESFIKYMIGRFDSEEEAEEIINEITNSKYIGSVNEYLIMLENDLLKNSGFEGLQYVVYIVCGIIVLTSVFCIKNSFDISITEKTKQYGMLRSIGATKKQIRKNVLYEATVLGLIGIPLGLILGYIASFLLVIVTNYLLRDNMTDELVLELSYSYISYIFAIILGIITIYLSAIRSAIKASKISPIDSIRNSASIKINRKKLKTPKIISKLFGIGGEISYKNIKRNRKKYRITILSIIVSVSVFVSLTYFMNLFMDAIKKEISYNEYNVYYSIDVSKKELLDKVYATTELENISDVSVVRSNGAKIENVSYNKELQELISDINEEYLDVITVGKNEYEKYLKKLNLDPNEFKNKAILIDELEYNVDSKKYKKRVFDCSIGDTLNLDLFTSNGLRLDIEIGYITNEKPFGFKNTTGNVLLVISDEYYDSNINDDNSYNLYFNTSNVKELQDNIDIILNGENYTIYSSEESITTMKRVILLIGIFLYGFIIVITLIGITNIFNTITTNMELRKPEFAMLKSVGMTNKEFNRMIRLESLFICLKSLLFGLPIGIVLSILIYKTMGMDEIMKFKLPLNGIVIACLFVFMLIFVLMKYSINKINKQNTIETIRNENI